MNHNKLEVDLTSRQEIAQALKVGKLYNLRQVARITGYCVRYLRMLCHARKVKHQKILARYYMTEQELSEMIKPVSIRKSS